MRYYELDPLPGDPRRTPQVVLYVNDPLDQNCVEQAWFAFVEARIAERAGARKAKDFARGDAIRDALLARGVALLDGPEGTTWDVE